MNRNMKPHILRQPLTTSFLVCCLFNITGVPLAARAADASAMRPLFNGTDLAGWRVPDPNPFWRVENGVLIGESDQARKGHVLYTEKEFKDFVLETEVRWS